MHSHGEHGSKNPTVSDLDLKRQSHLSVTSVRPVQRPAMHLTGCKTKSLTCGSEKFNPCTIQLSPQLYYHDFSGKIPIRTRRVPSVGFELDLDKTSQTRFGIFAIGTRPTA